MKNNYIPIKINNEYLMIKKSLIVEGLHDDYEGFRVLLRNGEDIIRIYFEEVFYYKSIDEMYLSNSKISIEESMYGKIIYKVDNSDLINEFLKISGGKGFYNVEDLVHYSILTDDDCIDVLSTIPPLIDFL